MKKITSLFIVLFGVSVSLPILLPLLQDGFFTIHDNTQVERVFEMKNALSDGSFPVRWVENLGYGYGYPIFNFYAPFPYYVGGFINLILQNSLLATKIMFGIGIVGSFFSMYLLARRFTNSLGGIVAGVLYLYFPYHAINIYVRGAVGEYFAYIFTPLIFLGIYVLYEKIQKTKKIPVLQSVLFSIPIALVIISHNLTTYMVGLFLIPYGAYFFIRSNNKKYFLASILSALVLSFFLAAFYLLPAVLESRYTDVASQIGGGADYPDHFVCFSQFWSSDWGFGGSIPGCVDGLSFGLGKFNILLVFLAFIFFCVRFIRKRKITTEIIFWLLLPFSLFLMTSYSQFIWDTLPYMEYLQYPWRFLNFTALFIAALLAFFVKNFKSRILRIIISLFIVSGVVYLNYQHFNPVDIVSNSNSFYENEEHIRFDTSKISDEYMPKGFNKPEEIENVPEKLMQADSEDISLLLINKKTGYIEFSKDGDQGRIYINQAYFPSWSAYVDNQKVGFARTNNGMSIVLSEGIRNVVFRFEMTPIQATGNALSIIGVIVVFVVIIVKRKDLYER